MQRAAIVGLGWWGQHILHQLRGSDVIRVAQAVGHRQTHRSIADEHGIGFTTEFERVLADRSIDLIILATPHALHQGPEAGGSRCDAPRRRR